MKNEQEYKCCICGKRKRGYGNNPYPVVVDPNAKCCDNCNRYVVVPERLREFENERKN